MKKAYGFTIVELLIVIVLIGILAAITLVSYNGVRQRANNTAIKDAAAKSYRILQSYVAAHGAYPHTGVACMTKDTACAWGGTPYASNATFNTNVTTMGTLPASVPVISDQHSGIIYVYSSGRTYNGVAKPVVIVHYLDGTSQPCGLPVTNSGGLVMETNPNGYTTANASGKTACVVSVDGPST